MHTNQIFYDNREHFDVGRCLKVSSSDTLIKQIQTKQLLFELKLLLDILKQARQMLEENGASSTYFHCWGKCPFENMSNLTKHVKTIPVTAAMIPNKHLCLYVSVFDWRTIEFQFQRFNGSQMFLHFRIKQEKHWLTQLCE